MHDDKLLLQDAWSARTCHRGGRATVGNGSRRAGSEHDHAGRAVLVHRIDSVDVHAGCFDDLGPELRIGLDAGLGVDTPGPVDQDVLRAEFFLKAR